MVWNRVAGNPSFPQTLSGRTPNLVGPAYLAALAAPEGSSATYAVTATDPQGAVSNTITLEIFAGPGLRDFVVLRVGPGSSTSPGCGSVTEPCATLAAAIAAVDPDGNTIGDGRDFIFTSGIFTATQARIPAGTSLLGGRSSATFTIDGESVLLHDGGTMTQSSFLLFGNNAQDAAIEDLTIRFARPIEGTRQAVLCDGCTLTIRDSVVVGEGSINQQAIRAIGASRLVAERVRVEVRGVRDNQEGFELSGSSASIIDCDVFVAASNIGGRNNTVTMNAGTTELERNRNGALANPCRDAGVTSSPAGVAPTDDIDGQPRVAPFDVGADEL